MEWKVRFGRRVVARFIPNPLVVSDGTLRCINCGQLDEPEIHDRDFCPGMGGVLPLTDKGNAFIAANIASPVVFGSARKTSGAYYCLKNGQTFTLSTYDVRSLPMPRWEIG